MNDPGDRVEEQLPPDPQPEPNLPPDASGATPPPSPETELEDGTVANTTVEEFVVTGSTIWGRVQELLQQGNIRQIVIKTENGRPLLTIPLTVGVAGGTLGLIAFPLLLVALAAIGLLAARLTIVIEKSVK